MIWLLLLSPASPCPNLPHCQCLMSHSQLVPPNPNPNFSSSGVRKRWPAVFLNKVFLACCHTHSSRVVYCCSCATRELRSHDREHMAQKAENIDYLKKCFIGIAFAWHALQSTFLMSTFLILHVPA